jgi:acyl-CoA synthetase (NDP forming)
MDKTLLPVPQSALTRLLCPKSIALVGVSAEPGSAGGAVLANLERHGYQGSIHLVSRTQREVGGRRCVASIDELPAGIDVAVLGVPQVAIAESVNACVANGIGAALIFASGFAEQDEAGKQQQLTLGGLARSHGFPILGPNCLGFVNYLDRVPLTFESVPPNPDGAPGVAVLAQSGAMAANVRMALVARKCPVAYSISTGNEAVIGVEDLLEWLLGQADTHAVAMLVEQIRDPARFLALAARALALGKPLVMLHPGRSERARDAALSHTGAMAGNYSVMAVLAAANGVVQVDTLEELFDVTLLLNRYPQGAPGGAGVLTNSGACKGIALDFADTIGLDLPALGEDTIAQIAGVLPVYASAENPLDVTTAGMKDASVFGKTASAMLADPAIGSLLVAVMGGSPAQQLAKAQALLPALAQDAKPALLVYMGDESPLGDGVRDQILAARVPFFRSPERALRALLHASRYQTAAVAYRMRVVPAADAPLTFPGAGLLAEHEAKALLAPLGLRVPCGRLALDVGEAVAIANEVGYPVVLKAQARALPHKSDVGGVAIRIGDAAALRQAWDKIHTSVALARPELQLDGLLVEAMAGSGVEMVVGARRDPDWGVVLLVGLGGIWIEVLKDFRLITQDATSAELIAEIGKLRGAGMLQGGRGTPPVDIGAVADTLLLLASLMRNNASLTEIDINPLVVYPAGEGVLALDALIVTAG